MQHDWLDKDFYKVLGVSEDVEEKELTKAYRKLARKYHPDANPEDKAAEERFKQVSEAYDILGNAERRKEYDQLRKFGPAGGMFGGGGRGGAGGADPFGGVNFDPSGMGDLGDILGGLFGGGRRSAPGARPRKGADLEADLNLSFDEAVSGVTTSVNLTSDAACDTCSGSGAAVGTEPEVCPHCHGRGVLDDDQGFFSLSQPCPTCSGRGRVVTNPCSNCRGSGIERKPRNVKVRVPAGVKNGQKIRLKGRGAPGPYGGPAGDLFVKVQVGKHALFGRKGNHLTIEVPITFAEAALGANVTVPTMDGKSVTLKVASGTPTGKTFRVKGRGVETKKAKGDLLVTVRVDVPTELSIEQQAALETLADVTPDSPRDYLSEAI